MWLVDEINEFEVLRWKMQKLDEKAWIGWILIFNKCIKAHWKSLKWWNSLRKFKVNFEYFGDWFGNEEHQKMMKKGAANGVCMNSVCSCLGRMAWGAAETWASRSRDVRAVDAKACGSCAQETGPRRGACAQLVREWMGEASIPHEGIDVPRLFWG